VSTLEKRNRMGGQQENEAAFGIGSQDETRFRFQAGLSQEIAWKGAAFGLGLVVAGFLVGALYWLANWAIGPTDPISLGYSLGVYPDQIVSALACLRMMAILFVLVIAILAASSAKIVVKPFALATLILGKKERVHKPGLIFLIPVLEKAVGLVDMRIFPFSIKATRTITADNIPVNANANMFARRNPLDLGRSVFDVEDWPSAMTLAGENVTRRTTSGYKLDELGPGASTAKTLLEGILPLATKIGGEVVDIQYADFDILDENVRRVYSLKKQAELEAEAKVIHARAETEVFAKYKETFYSIKLSGTPEELWEFVNKERDRETVRQATSGNRTVPFLDVGSMSGLVASSSKQRGGSEEA